MSTQTETINKLIRTRRSTFPICFSEEVIADDIIEQIIENANWAPTHGLTEPWRFTIFSGDGLRKLGEFQANWYKENTPTLEFLNVKYQKLLSKPTLCSHVISIGVSLENKNHIPEIEEIESVACAVQNMSLTAHAYNLGSYWGSGGVTYQKSANTFFGLEPKDLLVGFLFLGHLKNASQISGKRTDISTKVRFIK